MKVAVIKTIHIIVGGGTRDHVLKSAQRLTKDFEETPSFQTCAEHVLSKLILDSSSPITSRFVVFSLKDDTLSSVIQAMEEANNRTDMTFGYTFDIEYQTAIGYPIDFL